VHRGERRQPDVRRARDAEGGSPNQRRKALPKVARSLKYVAGDEAWAPLLGPPTQPGFVYGAQ
jgi:hypothetical protein